MCREFPIPLATIYTVPLRRESTLSYELFKFISSALNRRDSSESFYWSKLESEMPAEVLVQIIQELHSVTLKYKKRLTNALAPVIHDLESTFQASLLKAVERNETVALRTLLDLKLDPNVKYNSMQDDRSTKGTAVFIASQLGHSEAVSLLLEHHADPNLSADDKRTPLMAACSNNHLNIVEMLLKGGANIEERDKDDDTALRYAMANGHDHPRIAQVLLEKGADPNVIGSDSWSCLLIASCDNFPVIVDLLLKHGADPYVATKGGKGKTCLMLASQDGHMEVLNLLLNSEFIAVEDLINRQTAEGWTALALAYNHPKAVELLLTHGPELIPTL